jgi:hypothetical protein
MVTTIVPVMGKTDYYTLTVNGVNLGEFERSELREHMGKIDNAI